ncbi:MAG: TetR/AcrR family transcriptional regulator, partial [Nevskia sp.]|nr:TetR/AcrR family transcriptional regulator [Nevskia sp.]
MDLFWQRGYEGVSVADLTAAMKIAPPSLYAAFGSKAQ